MAETTPARDPVCGMDVDPARTATHGDRDFHFCSARCRSSFIADPERYLAEAPDPPGRASDTAPIGAVWTCPMHPQVRRDRPGPCPICGMALEPETVSAAAGPNAELTDMTRRFWIALVLTAPVFVLEMGGHLVPALHHLVPPPSRSGLSWFWRPRSSSGRAAPSFSAAGRR